LQLAAGLVGFNYPIGYGGLIRELLEVRLDKHETLTDWRRRPLTPSQVRYAFDDVRFLLPLADKLTRRLHRHHRGEWMVEECASLVRRSLGEEPGIERWRKLKGVASLDRKRLAIVREIYFWRETAAARFNRPARQVLRDDLIAEIARKNPHKVHDIEVIRGIPKREAADILAAVQAARSLPPEQLPTATVRDDDPAQVGLAVGLLAAVLGDVCARQKLAASLVGSNNDLRELVRATKSGRPVPVGNALSQGWRASAVLPHLLDVLQGRRAIRLGNLHDDAPFDYPDVEGSG
jgi:ribonuclease D